MVILVTFTAINGSTNLRREMIISYEISVAWKRTNAFESKAAADDKLSQRDLTTLRMVKYRLQPLSPSGNRKSATSTGYFQVEEGCRE